MRNLFNVIVVLALIAGGIWLARTHPQEPYYWLFPAAFTLGLIKLIGEIRGTRPRRQRPSRAAAPRKEQWDLVEVTVKGPALPVPPLQQAYGTLPPHCYRVMS